MKKWILAVSSLLLLAACKKETIVDETPLVAAVQTDQTVSSNSFSVSGWNNVSSWVPVQSGKGVYYQNKVNAPGLTTTNNSVVVFMKFLNYDSSFKDHPLILPTVIIPNEKYATSLSYSYVVNPNELSIQYALDRPIDLIEQPQLSIRYFVVSNEFLAAHNLTDPTLKRLTYSQLVNLLGVGQ